MTSGDIRRSFLAFFERHDHRIVPSSSLVPIADPTLLFINAGMNQFKDVFLGRERRDYRRAATAQKCMRVSGKHNDLDNVGPSLRHHTFFEMLGNFSFGDYFKTDAIRLAWSLLTEEWGLDAERLHPTIFRGEAAIPRDDEAFTTWSRLVPSARIVELGIDENFWSMGDTGPSGRCSEIHYFRGDEVPCAAPTCLGISCECDRFVEIWNNVFMEFDRQADGRLDPLPAPSIDTGMGLERIAAVMQGSISNYDTDVFRPLLDAVGALTNRAYGTSVEDDMSMRVVADHVRATTFLIGDGVVPSNEWRGYVLRKIMRRAMRHGMRLGLTAPFFHTLVDVVVLQMRDAYPELVARRDAIVGIVQGEEERFESVLRSGLTHLDAALDRATAGNRVLSGDEVFRLYDSLGLPVDFIEDLAGERRVHIDRAGYERAMEAQRTRARAHSAFGARAAKPFTFASDASRARTTELADTFDGYAQTTVQDVPVVAVFDANRQEVAELPFGTTGYVVLERTPFYVEGGGQVSDTGDLMDADSGTTASVDGMVRVVADGIRAHHVHVAGGRLRPGDHVTASVDAGVRDATRRNHTATHLLHAALRTVLGPHVTQAGSLVAPDRLRFDFTHGTPVRLDDLDIIEDLVNSQVLRNATVVSEVESPDRAIAAGAMALFGEKYGDRVRVVTVPEFSKELCGGTHCLATGDIGSFVIVHEGGVAAGVRRIEALTGTAALHHGRTARRRLEALVAAVGTAPDQAADAVARLQREIKQLTRDLDRLRMHAAEENETNGERVETIGDISLLTRRVEGLEKGALRELADRLRGRLEGPGVVVLAGEVDSRVGIVVAVSQDLTKRLNAGRIVKALAPIVGGGGGGRADFAEAGGKDPSRIDELLSASPGIVAELLT